MTHTPARKSSHTPHNSSHRRQPADLKLSFANVANQQKQQQQHRNDGTRDNGHILKQSSYGGMYGIGAAFNSGPSMVSESVYTDASSSQNFSFISGEIDSLFGMSMIDLMKTINNFVPKYRLCADKTQKQFMLLEFMLSFAN